MNPRVLIVDDVEDQRGLLVELFSRAGCDVAQAEGTEQAGDVLAGFAADIVVVDLLLAGDDDGWKAIERVRERAPSAAVVVTSVLDVTEFPAADAHLPKPFTGAQVRELVERLIPRS